MAKYRVTGPDGHTYNVEGPEGASDEEVLSQVKAYTPPAPVKTEPVVSAPGTPEGTGTQFVMGNVNKGIANTLGMPVDAAANALDFGKAVAGYAASKFNNDQVPNALQLTDRAQAPGSSAWIQEQMRPSGMITPGAEPESALGKFGASAIQAGVGGLRVPGAGATVPKVLASAIPAATSGLTGEAAAQTLGEAYRGVGMMAPSAGTLISPPRPGEVTRNANRAKVMGEAQDKGLVIPPATATGGRGNKILEGASGPAKLAKDASEINAPRINDLALEDVRLPAGTPLTKDVLKNAAARLWKDDYQSIVNAPALEGKIIATPAFTMSIKNMQRNVRKLQNEFKNTVDDNGTSASLEDFKAGSFSTDGAMKILQKLRREASDNLQSDAKGAKEFGREQKKIADMVEKLIEHNVTTRVGDPAIISRFKEARTQMAKLHDIEEATDPRTGDLNAQKLAKSDSPLTGNLKLIADFGANVPRAAQNVSRFGSVAEADSMATREGLVTRGMHTLMSPMRKVLLSGAYQKLLANPKAALSDEEKAVIRQYATAQMTAQPRPPSGDEDVEARAEGGPVVPGQPYVVGERGPEVIVPQAPGTVIPTNALQRMTGVTGDPVTGFRGAGLNPDGSYGPQAPAAPATPPAAPGGQDNQMIQAWRQAQAQRQFDQGVALLMQRGISRDQAIRMIMSKQQPVQAPQAVGPMR